MHIVFFSESYPPVTNGVAVSVSTLQRELLRRGHRVTVVTVRHPFAPPAEEGVVRVPSFIWPLAPDYPLPLPTPVPQLHRLFQREQVDIVHVQIPFLLGIWGVRLAKRYGVKVVAHYHTLYDHYLHYVPLPQALLRSALWHHLRRFYRGASATIVPSRFAQEYLRRWKVEASQVEVIPTGVEFHPRVVDRQQARARYGIAPQRLVLLYVGRLAREKNLELLLAMLPLVRQQFPEVLLWLVGGGNAEADLQRHLHREKLTDSVRLQGRVPHEEISAVYAASDLFVFPSVTETQGLVIWEAQAHGLPGVVVNEGGAPESIRDGVDGFLAPNHPEAFAQKVLKLLQDETLRHQMGVHALQSPRLTPSQMAERILAVYQQVLQAALAA